jgi:threonine synthase
LAATVLHLFFNEFSYETLLDFCQKAYSTNFAPPQLANESNKKQIDNEVNDQLNTETKNSAEEASAQNPPVILQKAGNAHFLELFHGPTLAFKDMALQILPYLLKEATIKQESNKEIVILTATSGDTGKAALEAFKDIEGIKIIVIYPKSGVSPTQRQHMITQEGQNTFVLALEGNFDDAQNAVKEIFNDKEFNLRASQNGLALSSANSINIGRLVPQIVYYIWAYLELVNKKEIQMGEPINITVPTGNFGNILAAFYAKEMGLPINKLICASNQNNVLTDFFATGTYNLERPFLPGISPSMDIIISSNLERLLYHLAEGDTDLVCNLMNDLKNKKQYTLPTELLAKLSSFVAGFASEEETLITINEYYKKYNYLLDPHTAVAAHVYEQYKEKSNDSTKTIIAATASPFKFAQSVAKAIELESYETHDEYSTIDALAKTTNLETPAPLVGLKNKPILHKQTVTKENIKQTISQILESN